MVDGYELTSIRQTLLETTTSSNKRLTNVKKHSTKYSLELVDEDVKLMVVRDNTKNNDNQ